MSLSSGHSQPLGRVKRKTQFKRASSEEWACELCQWRDRRARSCGRPPSPGRGVLRGGAAGAGFPQGPVDGPLRCGLGANMLGKCREAAGGEVGSGLQRARESWVPPGHGEAQATCFRFQGERYTNISGDILAPILWLNGPRSAGHRLTGLLELPSTLKASPGLA